MNVKLYVWQRATATIMAPLVIIHIAVIFYVSRQGLTAADILSRTHGSVLWAGYYGLFVAAASIHAGIGVRNVLVEWSLLSEPNAETLAFLFGQFLLWTGAYAVYVLVLS
jgi:fumarate reductase subunit C